MRTMDEKELTDIMTTLYDNRLKALIGYRNTEFTRDIIGVTFRRFREIAKETRNRGYREYPNHLCKIFGFMYGDVDTPLIEAKDKVIFLVNALENYQRRNLVKLMPDWKEQYPGVVFRNIFGLRFKDLLWDYPERYPEMLSHDDILSQLNSATFYRNQEAHHFEILESETLIRYFILYFYDVMLTYLLYTFYYMVLDADLNGDGTLEHLKD